MSVHHSPTVANTKVGTQAGRLLRQAGGSGQSKGRAHQPATLSVQRRIRTGIRFLQCKPEQGRQGRTNVRADMESSRTSGAALPADVRRFMEPRFGADFGRVRIHTGVQAARLSRQLNARAFTVGQHVYFGHGQFNPNSLEGKELIAHELTHTIQQGVIIQRSTESSIALAQPTSPGLQGATVSLTTNLVESRAESTAAALPCRERVSIREQTGGLRVQRFLGIDIPSPLDWLAEKANLIPFFRVLTIILGVNPINMTPVVRSPANILRALIEMMPGGGLVTKALENTGLFEKVGGWVQPQVEALGAIAGAIKQAIGQFIRTLDLPGDILRPAATWERAKKIFDSPVERVKSFAGGLVSGIVQLVKEAILRPIAKMAEGTNGYALLKAVMGRDPITADPVPQTAEALIGPFMNLIGEGEIWENMKRAKAIPRAFAWFKGALNELKGFVNQIPLLFLAAFQALQLADIILVPLAFSKLVKVFGTFLGKFTGWAGKTIWNLLEIIFDVVSPGALTYIKKTGAALKAILKNPIPFVGNLVKAAKLGFTNFADRFTTHLKAGLIDWLTGSLPGVYIPKAFSLVEFGKFALSVFGITWLQIRGKIVKALGPNGDKIMQGLETGFVVVKKPMTDGPAAVWELIKEQLTNLKDTIVDGIVGFIKDTVVQKAIPKLIAMFIPGAGFISAILSIYDTVMVFVQKLSKIVQVVKGFIDSIVAIAGGAIGAAASRVEGILAGLLSLAISFLAGFVSLGNIADKVMGVINKVRASVDKAIDKGIASIVKTAKLFFSKLIGTKDKAEGRTLAQKQGDLDRGMKEANALQSAPDASVASIKAALPGIKAKYKMVSLEMVVGKKDEMSQTIHIEGAINPQSKTLPTDVSGFPTRFLRLPPTKVNKKRRRKDLETLFPAVKGQHRSHAVGPITGDELVMGLSLASPEINLSLMKRVENLTKAFGIHARKTMKGVQIFQKIDVEQIVVQKGEIYLLQRITYQLQAKRKNETRIIGEFSIEVDWINIEGELKAKPRIEVEPIGFVAEALTTGKR
jgi:hypothetical protein